MHVSCLASLHAFGKNLCTHRIICSDCQKKGHPRNQQLMLLIYLELKLPLWSAIFGWNDFLRKTTTSTVRYLGTTCPPWMFHVPSLSYLTNLILICFLPYFHISRESHLLEYGCGYYHHSNVPFYFKYFLTQQLQRSMARYKHKRNVLM